MIGSVDVVMAVVILATAPLDSVSILFWMNEFCFFALKNPAICFLLHSAILHHSREFTSARTGAPREARLAVF